MRLAAAGLAAGLLAAAGPAVASAPCAPGGAEYGGFSTGPGAVTVVAMAKSWSAPVRAAVIQRDGSAPSDGEGEARSIWVSDIRQDKLCFRKLLSGRRSDDARRDLLGLDHPVFSLDGGFLYVLADAWATSGAVHQVNVVTGAERFVVDANTLHVIRDGPYRGMLLVQRRKHRSDGSYNPFDVVRPDGHVVLTVPGSERDDGERSLTRWLSGHGWTAF